MKSDNLYYKRKLMWFLEALNNPQERGGQFVKAFNVSTYDQEVLSGERFKFGENWSRFLLTLNDERIANARKSLQQMLVLDDLVGKKFLDIGSGSGLFSLAARQLGATVHSFDYDTQSVACTLELKKRYFPDDTEWVIEQGDVLDQSYLESLGKFDVVYSWGVLHHTGNMWQAVENTKDLVNTNGLLFIALYNDQGFRSKYWHGVKLMYNKNIILRLGIIAFHLPYLYCARILFRLITCRLKDPNYRGMNYWHDMLDWLGGYPFEVSKPENMVKFFAKDNFELLRSNTCGRKNGCNEYVFKLNQLI